MSFAPPSPALMPGLCLDRYELLALIAEGGMGQVWLARLVGKHGFQKLVAVKTLLPKYAADIKFQQMFLDEARIASGIEHTNVAQILDLGEQNGVLYLVMELVDGDALSKLTRVLTKAKLEFPIPIGLRIIADTCAGIHVAHELRGADGQARGIVHRDVSPQNILLTTTGVAKLIDFGIAKARDRFAGETSEGILKGKIHYMAPEQALGQKVDRRSDVFALGAILYQLFAGRPAYDGESQLEILHWLASGRPPLPLPASVPRPVRDVIRKALAARLDDRFQTALEMQRAINHVMAECSLLADTSDVATFAAGHLAERTEKRREAIEIALKAAAERAAMNATLLSPTSSKSSPGTSVPLGAVTPGRVSTPGGLAISGARGPEPPTVRSQSAADVDAVAMQPLDDTRSSAEKRRRQLRRAVLVGAAALGLAIPIALLATRGDRAPHDVAGRAVASALALPATPTRAPPLALPATSPVAEKVEHLDASVRAQIAASATPKEPGGRPAPAHTRAVAKPAASAAPVPAPAHTDGPDFGY